MRGSWKTDRMRPMWAARLLPVSPRRGLRAISGLALLAFLFLAPAALARPPVAGGGVERPVDDASYARLGKAARHEAFSKKETFTAKDLAAAMNRREPLGLSPAPPATEALGDEAFHLRAARATFALFTLSEKDYRAGNNARLGAAFLVHPGVAATCFHALKGLADPFAAVGLTVEGTPVKVKKILAVYPQEDLAFLQVEGGGDAALPLRPDAPAGMKVRALGHPLGKYFFAVEGMIARYGLKVGTGADKLTRLHLMIHSIGGFSGGAVMDAAGNAVGMLDSFETLKAGAAAYDVHSAIPAALILAHFTEAYVGTMTPEAVAAALKPDAANEGTVDIHSIKSEGPEGAAIAEVRSDEPLNFTVRIEDKSGAELARGAPSAALRAGLPAWGKELYDASVKAAEAKVKSLVGPDAR